MVQSFWKTLRRFLRKLNIELPYDPAIPFLGIYPDKAFIQKDTCILMLIAALFIIAKTWKQPTCPLTGMDKDDVVHIHNGILAIKKNEIMPFAATWMQLEILVRSEVSQGKTNIIYHLYVESEK